MEGNLENKPSPKFFSMESLKHASWRGIFRGLLVVFIMLVLFWTLLAVAGVMVAVKGGKYIAENFGSCGYRNGTTETYNGYGPGMMGRYYNNNGSVNNVVKPVTIAGTVSKIDGNKITVVDNSNTEQVIESTADTIITKGNKETGINTIKVGQFVTMTTTYIDGVATKIIEISE
jgi:hypothetical protein